ncbi:dipeptide ABC transporter ATP-binding protein [soil metagenome]
MSADLTALQANDLHVVLDIEAGLLRAVDALSLTLSRGETFALVGESGCGKSMTALALMRLLPDNGRIESGTVMLDGKDLIGLPQRAMRQVRGGHVGMLFQEPSTSLSPVMRVGDQIVEAIEAHTPLRGAAARARAIDWLGRVGLPEPAQKVDEYPFRLSGGQKQRVMIAMTLAGEPEFLLADEPTTALDVSIQAQILGLLRDLQREHGLGLMLITHDLAVVAGMAKQVALMYAGEIVELSSADDFFAEPKHPSARLLLQAVPEAGKRHEELAAIKGNVPPLTQAFEGCRFAPRCDKVFDACRTTRVPLFSKGDGREVRCLLYAPGYAREYAPGSAPGSAGTDAAGRDERPTPIGIAAGAPHVAAMHASPLAAAEVPEKSSRERASRPLLAIEHLTVRFPIRGSILQRKPRFFTAVSDVSLTIAKGATLALVGESGSGKTTLGKAVVQLLRRSAQTEGRGLLDGKDLFALEGEQLLEARRSIQIIFQDPFASLNPRMRVQEVLEEGMLALRPDIDAASRLTRVQVLLDQVGLRRDSLLSYPHEFSGGQRQRIAIARALAVRPRLIVCDEPTSALDVSVQAQILNLLRELQRELGLSYLFITHNIGVVEYVADQVAVMRGGRIEEVGAASQVLNSPKSAYTRALLDAVPRLKARASPVERT